MIQRFNNFSGRVDICFTAEAYVSLWGGSPEVELNGTETVLIDGWSALFQITSFMKCLLENENKFWAGYLLSFSLCQDKLV